MLAEKKLMTAEELLHLPEDGYDYELVRGELIKMTPPGGEHGRIALRLGSRLADYVDAHHLGEVMAESGYCLECQPDTVRGPDISFLSAERIPDEGLPKGFIQGAPDLAVEVVSPNDTVAEIQAKVQEYLKHGTRLVWVLEPTTRTITVYRSLTDIRILTEDDVLEGEDVVPGFAYKVKDVF